MALPTRIFNGEEYRQLQQNLPLNSGFESRLRQNTYTLAWLKAKREFDVNVGYPKLVRDTLMFQKLNFLANMSHLGTATGIWIHRLVS